MSNSVQIVKDTALNKTQVAEVYNGAHKVYNNQSTPAVLDVNLTGASGSHGLATEATLDSFRTENATNLGALDSSLTDGTAVVKCIGSEDPTNPAGTQKQLHVDGGGNVMTQVINTINVAPANTLNSGITNDPANSIAVGLRARTDIADSATETFLKCDATGVLQTSGSGGGGGSASTSYNNLAFNILKPTAPATSKMTCSTGIDLTNCSEMGAGGIYLTYQTSLGGDTADISDIVVQYSDNNTDWWSDATPSGGGSFIPTSNLDGTLTGFSTFFLEVMGFKAKWLRLCALHTDNTGIDMATTAHLQLRPF